VLLHLRVARKFAVVQVLGDMQKGREGSLERMEVNTKEKRSATLNEFDPYPILRAAKK